MPWSGPIRDLSRRLWKFQPTRCTCLRYLPEVPARPTELRSCNPSRKAGALGNDLTTVSPPTLQLSNSTRTGGTDYHPLRMPSLAWVPLALRLGRYHHSRRLQCHLRSHSNTACYRLSPEPPIPNPRLALATCGMREDIPGLQTGLLDSERRQRYGAQCLCLRFVDLHRCLGLAQPTPGSRDRYSWPFDSSPDLSLPLAASPRPVVGGGFDFSRV
jgi:hypothetical protein